MTTGDAAATAEQRDHVGTSSGSNFACSGAGIGRATCLLFAREGAKVVAVDLVADGIQALAKEIQSGGGAAEVIVADVSNAGDVEQCVQKTLGKFGRIDILVRPGNAMSSRLKHSRERSHRSATDSYEVIMHRSS